jgi:starvation-inducible outer membrane lipoprotein
MKKIILLQFAALFLLSGCIVVPEAPRGRTIVIDDDNRHCPPGQAKKGRC